MPRALLCVGWGISLNSKVRCALSWSCPSRWKNHRLLVNRLHTPGDEIVATHTEELKLGIQLSRPTETALTYRPFLCPFRTSFVHPCLPTVHRLVQPTPHSGNNLGGVYVTCIPYNRIQGTTHIACADGARNMYRKAKQRNTGFGTNRRR